MIYGLLRNITNFPELEKYSKKSEDFFIKGTPNYYCLTLISRPGTVSSIFLL
jgi:hypothetical protein